METSYNNEIRCFVYIQRLGELLQRVPVYRNGIFVYVSVTVALTQGYSQVT